MRARGVSRLWPPCAAQRGCPAPAPPSRFQHQTRWTDKFQHVVGILHTNYLAYIGALLCAVAWWRLS